MDAERCKWSVRCSQIKCSLQINETKFLPVELLIMDTNTEGGPLKLVMFPKLMEIYFKTWPAEICKHSLVFNILMVKL